MGVESLFTVQSGLTSTTGNGKSANSNSAHASLNFLDLILARLNSISPQDNSSSITSENAAALKAENALNIKDLLAGLSDLGLTETSDSLTTSVDPEQSGSLSLLQILQVSLGEDNSEISSQIKTLKDKIQFMIEKGDNAILTTNLTPEQITALENAQAGQWPEEIKGIGVIIIALVRPHNEAPVPDTIDLSKDPALANALAILTPPQQLKSQNASSSLEAALPGAEDAIASKLNSLTPGIGEDAENPFDVDFEAALKNAQQDALKGGKNNLTDATPHNTKSDVKNPQTAGPGFSALQGWPYAVNGGLFTPAYDSTGLYNDLGLTALSAQPLHSGIPGGLITQSASATLPHPATQAIAINIQKAANGGQNRTISMELDPPELGRIEVKLTFAKDKTMKAHVIAEKPETYMMLQRDADTLQRALESSGLEGDAGLSFELAQQGFDFSQNNERGGGHDSDGTGAGTETTEIIETTMTWHVDPASGHMRYDIYA